MADPWRDQRKLVDELVGARSGKHRAFIVLREAWRWLTANLTGRIFARVVVAAVLSFGLIGGLVGGVLHVLGGPKSLARGGLEIGAVFGLAIALVGLVQGLWLRRGVRRSLR